jgi:adenosylcobinamide kinase/adenosylcobinamide-phosphate guanylyltransferase
LRAALRRDTLNVMMREDAAIPCRTALVLGGARSGKSRYAQKLAESFAAELVFIATAEALDREMAARIARHRADRGPRWATREEPLDLVATLKALGQPGRVILVDCITLWLSNLIHAARAPEAEVSSLAAAIPGLPGPAIFVSNEVGLGIAPATELGREFRDLQGRANIALAEACDVVVMMTAGLPKLVKPAPVLSLNLT